MIRLVLSLFLVLNVSCVLAQDTPLRDPFSPYTAGNDDGSSSAASDVYVVPIVKLTGVIEGPDKTFAVLVFKGRRRIVSVGDTLGQYEVEVVTGNSVKLKGPDKTFILKIGQEMRI